MKTIEAHDLRKIYRGGVEALRGLSFEVSEGEIFGLLGPNGAGKSTTVRILATLSRPTGGRAMVAGHDVMKNPGAVRHSLGYVAQGSAMHQMSTGREVLMLLGRLFGLPGGELRSRVRELLDAFGLADAADRRVGTYSGGMRRRLDLAGGLVHEPRILFLDEPTTGLDPESRAVLWREVERLAARGMTILLTTHYLEEVDRLADRLAIVDGGRVVAQGAPEELKSSLRGDRVTVELTPGTDLEKAAAMLAETEVVAGEVVREGALLHVQVREGARAVPAVVGTLEGAGLRIAEVALSRPSLDDVYLQVTGHSFERGDSDSDLVTATELSGSEVL